ncbi:Gfo/Idh/MocA family oxidoreductase [Paenibacillus qinlingensis]|uniref:Dehydrogenase n=1 Tax=Paenibacillus qinlingensis TaxID=1837343 RepID=A0ABU1NRI1_9BACL|nr:Gfo/Idh/MocA family oxidoreductase [Paenibacillus qinlingensis]MDR6550083.1 putative dehydrogenase [Paenibacillus qinlingensis]
MSKKRYALVGCGIRAKFFYTAMVTEFKSNIELVAICDINQTRMDFTNRVLVNECDHPAVPTYKPSQFEEMVRAEKPDVIFVTSIDRTHHTYIIKAMELGCDVVSEKPMTVDADKCQAILDTVKRTGKQLRVAFNYRYAPQFSKVRELILDDVIGEVKSVNFEWLLDIKHGADYFRRWHRDKRNSGGLLVHKSTHHFDLVNFWLGTKPKTVAAMGDLSFYGRENAERRGVEQFYQRSFGSENALNDPFAIDLAGNDTLKAMYLDAEKEDGYQRDQSVFGDGISIEDTLGVIVRYENNAILTYSLNAYTPWEGLVVSLNGTKGRMEIKLIVKHLNNPDGTHAQELSRERSITVHPMFGNAFKVDYEEGVGGHGGGDPALLHDIFVEPVKDRLNRAATHIDGAMSILTGIAGNISMQTGQFVSVDTLVRF